jgi:predicted nuclease of predicted toxin-antitoxin system
VKLLFDQNLSHRLVALLGDVFAESAHVRELGLERADDAMVWEFARDRGYMIVSKDEDFHQRSFLYGPPPKVVWVRIGNCTTTQIAAVLRSRAAALAEFDGDPQAGFLVLA